MINKEITLSVISPVLNEEFFLPLYLEAVSQFADEILLLDGGSTDNSLEIIKEFQGKGKCSIQFWQLAQFGLPYTKNWHEGKRRNFLLKKAKGKWVLVLDVDEFLSDNFKEVFRQKILSDDSILLYGFSFIPFWWDVNTVRINTPEDPHWEGFIYRLIKRVVASYTCNGNHCNLLCQEKHPWNLREKRFIKEVKLFHYHYALGPKIKPNDNRRGDVNCLNNQSNPDWNYCPQDYQIKTRKFVEKHPLVIRKYLGMMK